MTLQKYFNDPRFLPHGFCLQWRPDLLALHVMSDSIIAASYFSIPLALLYFVRRREDLMTEHRRVGILFSVFILGCGITHVLGVVVLWWPIYVVDGWMKAFTAVASVSTAVVLWPLIPRLLAIPSPGQLSVTNALLQSEIAARRRALDELESVRANLESEVVRRTSEVHALARRFEVATSGSFLTVSEQDHELRYTWVHNQNLASDVLKGRTDREFFGESTGAELERVKQAVLNSGVASGTTVSLEYDGVMRHFEMKITPVELESGGPGILIASVDISEQVRQREHLQVILRELAHRAKNLLSLVEGIARQTAKAEGVTQGFIQRFGQRLLALGSAYDLLISQDWRGVDLGDLVRSQLAYTLPEQADRIEIEGPRIIVTPEAGQYLALALHELATNAVKYGVLGRADGRLRIAWRRAADPERGATIELTWSEDGAAVNAPTRSGFGRQLLESIVPRAVNGEAALDFGAQGVRWRILFADKIATY